jgi:hypothetical protein
MPPRAIIRSLAKTVAATAFGGPVAGAGAAVNEAIDLVAGRLSGRDKDVYATVVSRLEGDLEAFARSEGLPREVVDQALESARLIIARRGLSVTEMTVLGLDPQRVSHAVLLRGERDLRSLDEDVAEFCRTVVCSVYSALLSDQDGLPGVEAAFRRAVLTALPAQTHSLDQIADATANTTEELRELKSDLDRSLTSLGFPTLTDSIDWESRRIVRSLSDRFVGRDQIFERLELEATEGSCGYFRIIGIPGSGRTALAAAIADRYDAPAYFFDRRSGRTRIGQCLNHLAAELIVRRDLGLDHVPSSAGDDSAFLWRILEAAAQRQHPVWVVLSGVDEAERADLGANPVLLPPNPPTNVFFAITYRQFNPAWHFEPGVVDVPVYLDATENQADLRAYAEQRLRDTPAIRETLDRAGSSPPTEKWLDEFVWMSEGNFMWAEYVLADLGHGDVKAANLARVPRGLMGYYDRVWAVMEDQAAHDLDIWISTGRRVISLLAIACEPVTNQWIADHARRPVDEVIYRVLRPWQTFLVAQGPRKAPRWRVVHSSFQDYVGTQFDLERVHADVAHFYLDRPDRWAIHDGYATRHLETHLRGAGMLDELQKVAAEARDALRAR